MNTKEDIENYFLELYRKTKNYSYEKFLETVYHYNVSIGDYNKPIFFDLQKTIFEALKQDINVKPEIKYWDSLGWTNTFILFNKFFNYYNRVILDFPIFNYDMDKICPTIINFIIYNSITCKISVHKNNKNPVFKIEVYDIKDANRLIDFFESNNKIKNIVKSRVFPLLIQKYYIGIYREYDPYDFKSTYLRYLYEFFSLCKEEKEVLISRFRDFLSKIYRFEINPNEKRMLGFIIDYIYQYENINSYEKLFINNKSLKLSGYNCNYYNFIADEQGNMKFVLKEDPSVVVQYGSLEFLSLVYSKFYENNVKTHDSERIYDDFCGMYDSILSNNCENINILLKLVDDNKMNMTYKKMYLMASAYFAHKKFGIGIEIVNNILNRLLSELEGVKYTEEKRIDLGNKYLLTEEYGNKIVNLNNGKMITIKDYFVKNNVTSIINPEDIINLKDGSVTNGKVFLDNIYKLLSKYNSFNELIKNEISSIEKQNN